MSVRLVSAPGRLLGNLLKLSKRSRLPLLERSVNGTAIPPTAIEILASLRRSPPFYTPAGGTPRARGLTAIL